MPRNTPRIPIRRTDILTKIAQTLFLNVSTLEDGRKLGSIDGTATMPGIMTGGLAPATVILGLLLMSYTISSAEAAE